MKNFFLLAAAAVLLPFSASKADTFKLEAGADAYYITDDAHRDLNQARDFAPTNQYKDKFGINSALIHGKGEGDRWKANIGVEMSDGGAVALEEANVYFRLFKFKSLWFEGGYFYSNVPGDGDRFSWDNWFTTTSITASVAPGKEAGMGLMYLFNDDVKANVRFVNSGWETFDDNNRSKSVSLRLDWSNVVKDWYLNIGSVLGNEAPVGAAEAFQTFTAAEFGGTLANNLSGMLQVQFATRANAKGNDESGSAFGVAAAVKYAINPQFAVAGRVAFSDNKDGAFNEYAGLSGMMFGLSCEYRPVEFGYIRLEGNYLAMSGDSDDTAENMFYNGDEMTNARMDVGISAGVYFDIFSLTR